jgi:hypothetical protein
LSRFEEELARHRQQDLHVKHRLSHP